MIRKHENIIIQTVCRIMIPFMQLFSLYVLVHGHGSPGGGFQGGCILAASFILMSVAYGLDEIYKRFSERKILIFCSLGVFLYVATGFLCIFFGGNFLDYSYLSSLLHTNEVMARYYGMAIIETGVQITVMAVMIAIFLDLATCGKHEGALEE